MYFEISVMSLPKETSVIGELSRSRAYIMYNICTLLLDYSIYIERMIYTNNIDIGSWPRHGQDNNRSREQPNKKKARMKHEIR